MLFSRARTSWTASVHTFWQSVLPSRSRNWSLATCISLLLGHFLLVWYLPFSALMLTDWLLERFPLAWLRSELTGILPECWTWYSSTYSIISFTVLEFRKMIRCLSSLDKLLRAISFVSSWWKCSFHLRLVIWLLRGFVGTREKSSFFSSSRWRPCNIYPRGSTRISA